MTESEFRVCWVDMALDNYAVAETSVAVEYEVELPRSENGFGMDISDDGRVRCTFVQGSHVAVWLVLRNDVPLLHTCFSGTILF